MRRCALSGAAAAIAISSAAAANPWPIEKGSGEIISSTTAMRTQGDLAAGFASDAFSDLYADYGVADDLTLVANAAMARHVRGTATVTVFDTATLGARVPLKQWDYAALSAEIAGGIAGVQQPDAQTSAIALAGTGVARLMFGDGFTIFGRHGFAQIEAGWRWRAGAPADEILLDAGLGIEPWDTGLLMLQSFSTASTGSAEGAYRRYQIVKLQLSFAQHVTGRLWLQFGGITTVAGGGAGDAGIVVAGWWRF